MLLTVLTPLGGCDCARTPSRGSGGSSCAGVLVPIVSLLLATLNAGSYSAECTRWNESKVLVFEKIFQVKILLSIVSFIFMRNPHEILLMYEPTCTIL